jgi:hypothetical protein
VHDEPTHHEPIADETIERASVPRGADVTFTAQDLDRTIADYKRVARKTLARPADETIHHLDGEYGRLPAGSQGPHSPTD